MPSKYYFYRDYLRRMRHAFVMGSTPPDFPINNYEEKFADRANYDDDVTDLGHEIMGWPDHRNVKIDEKSNCNSRDEF